MKPISFKRHRFPPDVIRLALWLYYRFTESLRDVEDMLAERGHLVSCETIRCWANKFGQAQRFVSTHSAIYNSFNIQRHLISQNTMRHFPTSAMEDWNAASAAAA